MLAADLPLLSKSKVANVTNHVPSYCGPIFAEGSPRPRARIPDFGTPPDDELFDQLSWAEIGRRFSHRMRSKTVVHDRQEY